MGMYLNPDNQLLLEDVNSSIYLDKSMMLKELTSWACTNRKYVCVSRPRRFGKSMAGNMISAYFSKGCDSRDVFSKLKWGQVDGFDKYLNKLNVIKIDLFYEYSLSDDTPNFLRGINAKVNAELQKEFPFVVIPNPEQSFAGTIGDIYNETKEQFVIIIDEYDVLVRLKVPQAELEKYLMFLASLFKSTTIRPAISLAYLTGILPIVRDKIQSKMNEFDEYSMLDAASLSEFVGFTEREVQELCTAHDMDFFECKHWFQGYELNGIDIYSPKSVVMSIINKRCRSYWSATGSYDALRDYIRLNVEGIKDDVKIMIGGGRVDVMADSFLNTMTDFRCKDDVFTYLVHLGYLAYDCDLCQCYIPNEEVRQEWIKSIKDIVDYGKMMDMVNNSRQLLQSTIDCDEHAVEEALAVAHDHITSPLTYNNEASFQSAIGAAYFYANSKYTVVKELPTGKGYADLAFIPYVAGVPAIIIELKCNKTPEGAIRQIREKKYDDLFEHYRGDLLFVGVNYDRDTRAHQCKIEKLVIED